MRILIDTHAFLWFVLKDAHLSAAAKSIIADPGNDVVISPVTFWETAVKISLGKYALTEPFQSFFADEISNNRFKVLPVEIVHAAVLSSLPLHHRDPFDRLLVAQAMAEGIPLVSAECDSGCLPHYPTVVIRADASVLIKPTTG